MTKETLKKLKIYKAVLGSGLNEYDYYQYIIIDGKKVPVNDYSITRREYGVTNVVLSIPIKSIEIEDEILQADQESSNDQESLSTAKEGV